MKERGLTPKLHEERSNQLGKTNHQTRTYYSESLRDFTIYKSANYRVIHKEIYTFSGCNIQNITNRITGVTQLERSHLQVLFNMLQTFNVGPNVTRQTSM